MTQTLQPAQTPPSFWQIARRRRVVRRALRIALIVGVVLAAINHGGRILHLDIDLSTAIRIAVTFCVPYVVSTYSSVLSIREFGLPSGRPQAQYKTSSTCNESH